MSYGRCIFAGKSKQNTMNNCTDGMLDPSANKDVPFIESFHGRLEKITYEIGNNVARLSNKADLALGTELPPDKSPTSPEQKEPQCAKDALEKRISSLEYVSLMLEKAVNRICKFV